MLTRKSTGVAAADSRFSDQEVQVMERSACPTCGSCSGMFTANSMNCLTEALGLALPGNGSVLATHADRKRLFVEAGHLIVDLARRWYEQDDASAVADGRRGEPEATFFGMAGLQPVGADSFIEQRVAVALFDVVKFVPHFTVVMIVFGKVLDRSDR